MGNVTVLWCCAPHNYPQDLPRDFFSKQPCDFCTICPTFAVLCQPTAINQGIVCRAATQIYGSLKRKAHRFLILNKYWDFNNYQTAFYFHNTVVMT